jgi:hypothetical protein
MRQYSFLPLALTILTVVSTARSSAEDPATLPANATAAGKFVVHEWGTFTTFSGSDGVFMEYRPLAAEHSDLPHYVLDRGSYSPGRWIAKSRLWGRVRMETPVTYFYTDRVRTIDVQVDFPQGLLTEFYPPVREMLPPIDHQNIFGAGEAIGNSRLNWGQVDLIPTDQLLPNVQNAALRETLTADMVESLLPHAANEQHYAAARETDAALVHVRGQAGLNSPVQSFFEKFLFYRGVGKFQLPVNARFDSDQVVISNDGALPMNSAIMIHFDGNQLLASRIDQVAAGESLTFDNLKPLTAPELGELVQQSLIDEGLYAKEADSMVKTWQQSWFTEIGTRVLYMVPGPTTDELLPLSVTPRPQEMLRVLVGRMEIMSPEDEQRMIEAVAASVKTRAQHHAQPVAKGKQPPPYEIPASVRAYGRMAEPALVRVSKISKDPAVRGEAQLLIAQYQRLPQ